MIQVEVGEYCVQPGATLITKPFEQNRKDRFGICLWNKGYIAGINIGEGCECSHIEVMNPQALSYKRIKKIRQLIVSVQNLRNLLKKDTSCEIAFVQIEAFVEHVENNFAGQPEVFLSMQRRVIYDLLKVESELNQELKILQKA